MTVLTEAEQKAIEDSARVYARLQGQIVHMQQQYDNLLDAFNKRGAQIEHLTADRDHAFAERDIMMRQIAVAAEAVTTLQAAVGDFSRLFHAAVVGEPVQLTETQMQSLESALKTTS